MPSVELLVRFLQAFRPSSRADALSPLHSLATGCTRRGSDCTSRSQLSLFPVALGCSSACSGTLHCAELAELVALAADSVSSIGFLHDSLDSISCWSRILGIKPARHECTLGRSQGECSKRTRLNDWAKLVSLDPRTRHRGTCLRSRWSGTLDPSCRSGSKQSGEGERSRRSQLVSHVRCTRYQHYGLLLTSETFTVGLGLLFLSVDSYKFVSASRSWA